MSGIKDSEKIEALRQRLYERGASPQPRKNHSLSDTPHDVPTVWRRQPGSVDMKKTEATAPPAEATSNRAPAEPVGAARVDASEASSDAFISSQTPTMNQTKRRGYRLKVLLAGLAFFVGAMAVSSFILLFGNNTISGENIDLSVTGPFTIGGGEVLPVQVGITNNNAVPIESATLLIEYPRGSVAATEEREQLFAERMSLETIQPGETVNVPLRAVVFGEENDELMIKVSIEYRVNGSNAVFFKEADPLRFKISSSPVTVQADVLKKVSSGQETEVTLTITSNSPSTLSDVLVQAEYPVGFEFLSASPSPNQSNNSWLIEDLAPESSQEIVVTGVVVGDETDEYAINFRVGVPEERNQQAMASLFSTVQTQFEIEQPFINLTLEVGGDDDSVAVVGANTPTTASVIIENTLNDSLYDVVVSVELGGNALSDLEVGPPNGFYDSVNNTIIWDISNSPELEELQPGETTRVSFTVVPAQDVARTPEVTMRVDVKGRRVSESQVAEMLVGTANGSMRVESNLQLRTDVSHDSGLFSPIGSIPPQAESETSYTITLLADNGSNDVTDAVVTATLPSYVTWKDQTSGTGELTYDEVRRQITWRAGNIDANAAAVISFQVGIVPSVLQIGTSPTLIAEQSLTANDRFTETTLRKRHPARTTEMSSDAGYEKDNGRVVE